MKIQLYDANNFILMCSDKELRETIQAHTDGSKIRGYDQIIFPIKSGPKLRQFEKYGIEYIDNSKEVVAKIENRILKREDNINKIKKQYGGTIKFDYDYKGVKEYTPMDHQKIMFNILMYSDVGALLADPGTCKTAAYLWAIDAKIKQGKVKKALIITLASLKKNVLEEMSLQVPHLSGVVLTGTEVAYKVLKKAYKKYADHRNVDYDVYIANYESMYTIKNIFDNNYFDMVILDEAHRIGAPNSRQTKVILDKFENIPYKYIVTATLHANNLMSFFMPFRFMGPDIVPVANYYEFRRKYMHTVDPSGYIWKESPGSRLEVRKIISKVSVLFTKEECLDLPPLIRQKYSCSLGKKQSRIYDQMKKDLIAIIENMCHKCNKRGKCDDQCDDEITAKNILVKIGKLNQIACGFYINTRYELSETGSQKNVSSVITLDENPKLGLLIQTLNNVPSNRKVIIWSHHTPAIELIKKALEKAFGPETVLTCYGDQDAFDQVKEFKNNNLAYYMVANPMKMGVGQNMQYSNYQIFFSNSYSWIQRDQAEGRQHRQGQNCKVTVIDLVVEETIDEIILDALSKKKDLGLNLSQWAKVLK